MKSVICHKISEDISTVSFEEIDLRPPKGNEVQIKMMACAVNFPDLLMIQGKYQFKPPLPFSPGGEFSGEVVDVGEDVTGFSVGDRVVGGARYGGFFAGGLVQHCLFDRFSRFESERASKTR